MYIVDLHPNINVLFLWYDILADDEIQPCGLMRYLLNTMRNVITQNKIKPTETINQTSQLSVGLLSLILLKSQMP